MHLHLDAQPLELPRDRMHHPRGRMVVVDQVVAVKNSHGALNSLGEGRQEVRECGVSGGKKQQCVATLITGRNLAGLL